MPDKISFISHVCQRVSARKTNLSGLSHDSACAITDNQFRLDYLSLPFSPPLLLSVQLSVSLSIHPSVGLFLLPLPSFGSVHKFPALWHIRLGAQSFHAPRVSFLFFRISLLSPSLSISLSFNRLAKQQLLSIYFLCVFFYFSIFLFGLLVRFLDLLLPAIFFFPGFFYFVFYSFSSSFFAWYTSFSVCCCYLQCL